MGCSGVPVFEGANKPALIRNVQHVQIIGTCKKIPTKVGNDSRRGSLLTRVDQGRFTSGERTKVALKLETDVGRRGEPGFDSPKSV